MYTCVKTPTNIMQQSETGYGTCDIIYSHFSSVLCSMYAKASEENMNASMIKRERK